MKMNGKVREVIYFSEGFFGYGEMGNFRQWSFAHFAPIVFAVVAILLIYRYRENLRNNKHEKTFRVIYCFIMLMVDMSYFWRLSYVGPGTDPDKTMMGFLPFQVCQWTLIATFFMMMTESRRLFNLSFFLTMSAGLLPLFFPAVISAMGPTYYRYYQFWGEHLLPIIGMYYMMFVHEYKPKAYGIPMTIGALFLLAIPCVLLNNKYEDAHYLYLKHDNYSMLSFLPDSIFITGLILTSAILALLSIDWLVYRLITRPKKKKSKTVI